MNWHFSPVHQAKSCGADGTVTRCPYMIPPTNVVRRLHVHDLLYAMAYDNLLDWEHHIERNGNVTFYPCTDTKKRGTIDNTKLILYVEKWDYIIDDKFGHYTFRWPRYMGVYGRDGVEEHVDVPDDDNDMRVDSDHVPGSDAGGDDDGLEASPQPDAHGAASVDTRTHSEIVATQYSNGTRDELIEKGEIM